MSTKVVSDLQRKRRQAKPRSRQKQHGAACCTDDLTPPFVDAHQPRENHRQYLHNGNQKRSAQHVLPIVIKERFSETRTITCKEGQNFSQPEAQQEIDRSLFITNVTRTAAKPFRDQQILALNLHIPLRHSTPSSPPCRRSRCTSLHLIRDSCMN